jgi:hypothetical protein
LSVDDQPSIEVALDTPARALEAHEATGPDDPDRPAILSNLGDALKDWFEYTGTLADLGAPITIYREALAATPTEHPNRYPILTNLAIALHKRFNLPTHRPIPTRRSTATAKN